ncbi:MAG: ADP-ribosylglycohydrolase family protein [Pseudomonadales bacterium]|nr:ADP-ribosylglycohydrolase family protein [Pseudomonadales bacterium]
MSNLPEDYTERVYAGVLGKVIGVYLGRPFEGWTYELIQERLGDITDYVNDKLDIPLLVTDDDISGTFTFARAMADNNFSRDLTSAEIGRSWMNYLIEERTILWWGGLGNSTEHTAYLRLKNGIEAPLSGSTELNGQVVSEQIGAQIFIDGWAMMSPGDADRAAYLATEAAKVSHDGAAVDGAVMLAVMEAMAFVERDTNKLLDGALKYIPDDSIIRRLINDVRNWHAGHNDWRDTRQKIEENYGYDKYGGNCHMVPNHGLIIQSLLHSNDDFSLAMEIINTSGWDTDCNSGNLGCLMGIKNGLPGIDAGLTDWRGPIADRIYVPTADPSWGISDCVREADAIIEAGVRLSGDTYEPPKNGAQMHFSYPGSTQGFTVTQGEGEIVNEQHSGRHQLRLSARTSAEFGTPVFAPTKEIAKMFENVGYALLCAPRIYPGQVVTANVTGETLMEAALYMRYYGENDQPTTVMGESQKITGETSLSLTVPVGVHPVFEVGLSLPSGGCLHLDSVSWTGAPTLTLTKPNHRGSMWRRAFVNGADVFDSRRESMRIIQNSGTGLLIQGTREWYDYQVSADITPHLVESAGLAGRVQGMRRYYALRWHRSGELQLIKMLDESTVLASIRYDWSFGDTHELTLRCNGTQISALIDGQQILAAEDNTIASGSVALLVEAGRSATQTIQVAPLT